MKKVLTTIALSLSALVATSAMAAPQHDPRYAPHKPASHWNAKDSKKWNDNRRDDRRYNNRGVNPSRDWRTGQKLPKQYDNRRFEVSAYEARRLPNANKNQQWYKINGDYVLVNERNDKIVRIMN